MQSLTPTVSIVVPCRDERDHIAACVRSLLDLEPPPGGFEILIVDGMSDDGTREILRCLAAAEPRLRLLDNPRQITPCAMNVGICAARGRYIAIMGAHNRYAPDYLRQGVAVLEETGADNVGGAMICEAQSRWQEAIAAAHHSAFAVGGARWHNPSYEGPADTVFGGLYRREVFERLGLFDEELVRNQDDEFNLRLRRAGGKIWQSPRLRSWYRPRASLRGLFRQYLQYGYWKVRIIQKHKLPASVRHLVPGGFVFAALALPVASLGWPAALWGWLGMMALYATSNAIASIATAARRGWRLLPRLPLVFACYHLAYGLGFLCGVWDFGVRRRGPTRWFTDLTRTTASPAAHRTASAGRQTASGPNPGRNQV
jgi:succinoglycan biosynthesis protein ExoA